VFPVAGITAVSAAAIKILQLAGVFEKQQIKCKCL
jgi:hypothetical protein